MPIVRIRRSFPLLAALTVLTALTGCGARPADTASPHPNVELVRAHFDRFNDHDAEGVRDLAADDVAWYTIHGDQITVNSAGADALVSSLRQYFQAVPGVHAEIEHIHADGAFAMVRERVSWTGSGGAARSQASFSCYEIRDSKIKAVWYFSAE